MELLLAFLLLACAAMSGTEVAIFSLTRLKLRKVKNEDPELYTTVTKLRKRPQDLLAGILLGNEITNVSVALTVGVIVAKYFPNESGWGAEAAKIFFGSFLVMFFG